MSNENSFDPSQEHGLGRPISRRVFFSLTAIAGALTFQGSALGGTLQAWADESNTVHFVVYMLSKYEVPIMAYDVSDGKQVPLANCKVTVTSWVTNTSKTVTTDQSGFAPMNVKDLSFQKDDDSSPVFNLWGGLAAECDSYRQYYEESRWIESGVPADANGNRPNVINIPTQPVNGKPYLRSLTLDDSDIQYAQGIYAYVSESNTDQRDIVAQVVATQAGTGISASVRVNGVDVSTARGTASTSQPYIAQLTFTDKWLSLLKPGDVLSVQFAQDGDTTTYQLTSPLVVKEGVSPADTGSAEDVPVSPGADPTTDPESDENMSVFPTWMCMDGDKCSLTLPWYPISFVYGYGGRILVYAVMLDMKFLDHKSGKKQEPWSKRWHAFGGLSANSWSDAVKDEKDELLENAKNAGFEGFKKPTKKVGWGKLTKKIEAGVSVAAFGAGECERTSEGDVETCLDLGACVEFEVTFGMSMPFTICGIPFYWSFDVSALAELEAFFGVSFTNWLEDFNWANHYMDGSSPGAIAIILRAEVGLSAGVGVQGLAAIAIGGYAYITAEFVFDKSEDKPWCQTDIVIGANVYIEVQALLLFKLRFSPSLLPDYRVYSNTEEPQSGWIESNISGLTAVNTTLCTDEPTLVTDKDLDSLKERIAGAWAINAEGKNRIPRFASVSSKADALRTRLARVNNPFYAASAYNPINGLKPTVEELLWEGCFSNPRMRIVHTSTDGFADDRCFMVRIAVVEIKVPHLSSYSAPWFRVGSSVAGGDYQKDRNKLRIDAIDCDPSSSVIGVQNVGGNQFVKVLSRSERLASADMVIDSADSETTVNRTRLVICEWNHTNMTWGDSEVIDFICEGECYEMDRVNALDSDFDVDVDEDGSLLFAITTMERPEDANAQSMMDYEKKQYVSLVRWDPDKKEVVATGSTRSFNTTGKSLFHPRIVRQFFDGPKQDVGQYCMVYSYVCEYDTDGSRSNTNLAVTVFDDMVEGFNGHRVAPPVSILPSKIANLVNADVLATGTFEVACPDRTMKYSTGSGLDQSVLALSWSRPQDTSDYGMNALSFVLSQSFSIAINTDAATGVTSYVPDVNLHGELTLSGVPGITKLTSRDQRGLFSYADPTSTDSKKPLRVVTLDKESLQLGTVDDAGKSDKTMYFSSFNGRRLYTVRAMDGTGPSISNNIRKAINDGVTVHTTESPYNSPSASLASEADYDHPEVKLFQLLEARWVDELQTYYDFYPIAQLEHAPDNIGVIATNDIRTDFTFATITDFDKSLADMYQVAVPKIMSCVLSKCEPLSPYAAAGDKCWYNVTVRNTGNAPITSITLKAMDSQGNKLDEVTFDDLSLQIAKAEGAANDDRDTAGILWPGTKRDYNFYFTIPFTFAATGDTQFDIMATACADHMDDEVIEARLGTVRKLAAVGDVMGAPRFLRASDASLSATSEIASHDQQYIAAGEGAIINGKSLAFKVAMGKRKVGSALTNVGTANYATVDSSGKVVPSDGSGGSTAPKTSASTGDSAGGGLGAGLMGAALGAAALGVAAYERRRAENEAGGME